MADDMGLGKTVQALTMLQHYCVQEGGIKAIVICPTTLIYNCEKEIKKYTPSQTWQIQHGSMRTRETDTLQKANKNKISKIILDILNSLTIITSFN